MRKPWEVRNSQVFHDYYSRLKMIATSVFEWEGLPETCNARFLEDVLFEYGAAIFVNDENLKYLNLKVTPSGELNVYNEPIRYKAYGTGYDKTYALDECVYIRNNPLAKSTNSTIILYAERLADLDRTIEINTRAQKTPVLVQCDEKTRTSLENIYRQYDGNRPVIFGNKSMIEKPLNVLNTGAPFVADKLREEKRAVWNEALEFLGLNTNPADKKKERLIVNEVDANNEQIDIQCDVMLAERVKACEAINTMFGLNVSVRKRVGQEVEQYGNVYDRTAEPTAAL